MADSINVRVPRGLDGKMRAIPGLKLAEGPLVDAGDALYVAWTTTDATCTITFQGRWLSVEGDTNEWSETATATGAGAGPSIRVPVGAGWVIGFSIYVSAGTITAGEVEAACYVVRNTGALQQRIMCLCSGDLTNAKSLGMYGYT